MAEPSQSLESSISTASVPELKYIVRKITSHSPTCKETITHFLSAFKPSDQNSINVLREVISKTCQELEEAWDITSEALADEEEDCSYVKKLIEDTGDVGYQSSRSSSLEESETTNSKKRKLKWMEKTSPRSEPKRVKTDVNGSQEETEKKPKSLNSKVKVPSSTPYQKKSIDKIFAADAARRASEEAEQIVRVNEIQASISMDAEY